MGCEGAVGQAAPGGGDHRRCLGNHACWETMARGQLAPRQESPPTHMALPGSPPGHEAPRTPRPTACHCNGLRTAGRPRGSRRGGRGGRAGRAEGGSGISPVHEVRAFVATDVNDNVRVPRGGRRGFAVAPLGSGWAHPGVSALWSGMAGRGAAACQFGPSALGATPGPGGRRRPCSASTPASRPVAPRGRHHIWRGGDL